MPLLCYDPRHLGLITTPSLHAFCKTAGHQVKVQEHLQILQPEGPASPPWLRVGLSFRELRKEGRFLFQSTQGDIHDLRPTLSRGIWSIKKGKKS